MTTVSISKKSNVFHFPGCCHHSKRIKIKNTKYIDLYTALKKGCRPCKYCCTVAERYKAEKEKLEKICDEKKITLSYDKKDDALLAWTNFGFWKIIKTNDTGLSLFHLNEYFKDRSAESLSKGIFHRQTDVRLTYSLSEILGYVGRHDEAKKIIMIDYRKLPKRTIKEKIYFNNALRRSKEKRKKVAYVHRLINSLRREREYAERAI